MGDAKEALLHSCTVYLYRYDAAQGAYAQQTDSALGCALLGATHTAEGDPSASTTFKLLLYNAHKQPVLQLPVALSTRFTPQSDTYVHFCDADQQNCSLRFRDAAESAAFLSAAALARAHVFVHSQRYYKPSRGDKLAVSVDALAAGKADGEGLAHGDVAGLALERWEGGADARSRFFSPNPLDIPAQPAVESVSGRGSDVKRVRLAPYAASASESDPLACALAAEALVGMRKGDKRLVAVVAASTQQWFIARVELVKVKKAPRASPEEENEAKGADEEAKEEDPPRRKDKKEAQEEEESEDADAESHAELVKRMASISRAGSHTSGLMASLSSRLAVRRDSAEPSIADRQAGTLSLPRSSASSADQPLVLAAPPDGSSPSSLAAKVLASLQQSPRASAASFSPEMNSSGASEDALSTEMAQLRKEQADLEHLRLQLEASKKQLQADDASASTAASSSTSTSAASATTASSSSSAAPATVSTSYKPWDKPGLSLTPFEALPFTSGASTLPSATAAPSASHWTPSSSFELVSSFSPPAFASALTPYSSSRSTLGAAYAPSSSSSAAAAGNTSGEMELGIARLQRSSTSIESKLDDLQVKMDRLMNMQSSFKTGKYSAGGGGVGGGFGASSSGLGASSSSGTGGAATASSASLLKSLERALGQRDQLQERSARLQEAVEHLEATVEDLAGQHESLQLENRNLLDRLQSGSQLQQDKFRLELRGVQQQLSHAQEQMLVFQEENFHLRSQLAAKDEQFAADKARAADDARKQLEQRQRQLQEQAQLDARDALRRMTADKEALEAELADAARQQRQWQQEREALASQLRQAQTQTQQLQSDKARAQAGQDTRVRELEAQLQQARSEAQTAKLEADRHAEERRELEQLLAAKDEALAQMQTAKSARELAALSELLKEFMNDIYFHFQDAFDEEAEFSGKEAVMAIRKILKHNTMEILARLEDFWQLQGHDSDSGRQ